MALNFSTLAARDFVYKQNPDGTYIIKDGDLERENINDIIDTILDTLRTIYINLVTLNGVNPGRLECNDLLLHQALTRYSRDIFGERRLEARLNYLIKTGTLTSGQRDILAEYADYGFKTNSRSPYIHRWLANLLYWLSTLKPFAVYPEDNSAVRPLGVAFEFHNEYISYLFALAFLKVFNQTLTIHEERELFYDFLYDLHYRNLTRSSLEFFLNAYVKPV